MLLDWEFTHGSISRARNMCVCHLLCHLFIWFTTDLWVTCVFGGAFFRVFYIRTCIRPIRPQYPPWYMFVCMCVNTVKPIPNWLNFPVEIDKSNAAKLFCSLTFHFSSCIAGFISIFVFLFSFSSDISHFFAQKASPFHVVLVLMACHLCVNDSVLWHDGHGCHFNWSGSVWISHDSVRQWKSW